MSAELTGSLEPGSSQAVSLTSEGSLDWAHWGLLNANSVTRKNVASNYIGDLTVIGSSPGRFGSNSSTPWSRQQWTDGTPTASQSGFSGGLYFNAGNSYQIAFPADTQPRVLKVYLGGYKSQSRIEATLSDGSAPAYTATFADLNDVYHQIVTINYSAASDGQTLTFRHTRQNNAGNIAVQAAALQGPTANQPPQIAAIGNRSVSLGSTLAFTVSASDSDGPAPLAMTISSSTPNLPAGASYVDNGGGVGSFNWTPGSGDIGSYAVTFMAQEAGSGGQSATQTINLSVADPGSASLAGSSVAGSSQNNDLTAVGTADWKHWGLANANSVNQKAAVASQISDLTVSGSAPGRFGSAGGTPWSRHSWSDGTPTVSQSSFSGGLYFNTGNSYQLTVPAGTQQRVLMVYLGGYKSASRVEATLSDGSTPAYVETFQDLSDVYHRIVTITYAAASDGQTLTFRHTRQSSAGNIAVQAVALQGQLGNQRPVIQSIGNQSVTAGSNLSFAVNASDPDGPSPLLLSVTSANPALPAGVSFTSEVTGNTSTGLFDWTPAPADAGVYAVTFGAREAGGTGLLTEQTVQISVNAAPANQPPQIAAIGDRSVSLGSTLAFTVSASDSDGPAPLAMTISSSTPNLPAGASYVDNGGGVGSFNWTPGSGDIGSYAVTFMAQEAGSGGQSATQTINLSVADPGSASLAGSSIAGSSQNNDLTAVGTADWKHWGLANANSVNRKAAVASQISDLTVSGSAPGRFGSNGATPWSRHSWSDGTPTVSQSSFSGGLYFNTGNSYQLTVPAGTQQRVLKVYLGGYKSASRVEATLSDGSAPAYVETFQDLSDVYHRIVTITYAAASDGQTLTFRHTRQSSAGNIAVQAAALQGQIESFTLPFTDDFNDGDYAGWTIVDETDFPSNWQVLSNAMELTNRVQSRNAYEGAFHLGSYAIQTSGFALTDYEFSVTASFLGDGLADDIGILFRYSDADNYYRLSLNSRYGFTRLEKRVAGTFVPLMTDGRGFARNETLNLKVELRGPQIIVSRNGDLVFAVTDSDNPTGTVGLYAQERSSFDDVQIRIPEASPRVVMGSPIAFGTGSDTTVTASALTANAPPGASVVFTVDGSSDLQDSTPPYSATWSLSPGNYQLKASLRNASNVEIAADTNTVVGAGGENLVAIGESNTNGSGDEYESDNSSALGRVISFQGYQAQLTDLLDSTRFAEANLVFNEGIGGDETYDTAFLRLNDIRARHLGMDQSLVLIGTNDALHTVPSGAGCASPAACAGSFKGNLQTLVDKLRWVDYPTNTIASGITPIVAIIPPAWTSSNPWSSSVNNRIRGYNAIIRNEIQGIAIGPNLFDFYMPSSSTNYRSLFADTLHLNGLGHQTLAYLWHNILEPGRPLPIPFVVDALSLTGTSEAQQNLLEVQDKYYVDSDFQLVSIPSELTGGRWVMTKNEDRNRTGSTYASFVLDRSAQVYVAYDASATSLPAWLDGYADTGLSIDTTNGAAPLMKLYVRNYAAGPVSMGGNLSSPAAGARANYVVIVVEN